MGPERLMREDLVLVTVEYRVGPLGKFMYITVACGIKGSPTG